MRNPPLPVLQVQELVKRYRALTAVDGVSFAVHAGEIVGLLGPNGAGKTTTISMILGLLAPSAGSVTIDGHDVATDRAQALASANFAAVYAPLPGNLTVRQNLRFFGRIYGVPGLHARIEALLDEFSLGRLRDTRCGLLSSGEQTRASLAKAMLNAPRLLLLDEPTASLDPATARDLRAIIRGVAHRERMAVLWTSHNMLEVEAVCDRVLFLSRGRVLLEGDPHLLPAERGSASLEELFIRVAREPLSLESRA
ncbi:MAG TPA: ABC transporter ATP-binding protein [Nevskiaceae bacterium]